MAKSSEESNRDASREYLSSDEMKASELSMLVAFRDFCEAEGLRYSLCGGTLLGAVRHKGFIPWDDDVDVCMPRPDYERFVASRAKVAHCTGLDIAGCFGLSLDKTPFVKLLDTSILVKASMESEETFLWVDVFPVDAFSDNNAENRRAYARMSRLRLLLIAQHSEHGMGHSVIRRLCVDMARPVLRASRADLWLGRKMNELATKRSWESTAHVGISTWGMHGLGERMPLAGFESQVEVEFEGECFAAMSCWGEYLTGVYGDYMQLPPEDERHAHGIVAWRVAASVNDTEEDSR